MTPDERDNTNPDVQATDLSDRLRGSQSDGIDEGKESGLSERLLPSKNELHSESVAGFVVDTSPLFGVIWLMCI